MPNQDENNLDLLSTFHYITGVLTALVASIPLIHLVIGIVMLASNLNRGDFASRNIALTLIIIAAVIILAGWTFGVLLIVCGSRLKKRRSYSYCLVVAYLECLIVPIGTVLGIFSILTLTNVSVKKLFS